MVETHGRRFKRIDSAFNIAAARARPPCDSSSGSDHSPDLSDLVASFIEREEQIVPEEEIIAENDRLKKLLGGLSGGGERMRIKAAATDVAGKSVGDITQDSSPKRQLMALLRDKGFDAGLCKSRWERFDKNPAGKYEYVDVRCDGGERYIVETDLDGEFEIARPTKRYISILSQVPRVFVGTPEELKQLVKIMCREMSRSMKHVGIHVPPWRRSGYMQAKWFGSYKRTSTTKEMVISTSSSIDTTTFKSCKEDYWKAKDFKVMVGQLTVVFSGSGVGV